MAILVTALGPVGTVGDFVLGWSLAVDFAIAAAAISLTLPHVRSEVSAAASMPARLLVTPVPDIP